jgi:hypothetical protein
MPLVANFLFFKAGWLSSVLGGANQMPWLGPLAVLIAVLAHLRFARRPGAELALIVSAAGIGAVFDSVLVAAGLVSYSSGMFSDSLAPYWIIGMWILFATTLNLSLSFLKGRLVMASVMGFVAGPLAYLGGSKLGGIEFVDQTTALAALAVGWAVIMPALTILADRAVEPSEARTTP